MRLTLPPDSIYRFSKNSLLPWICSLSILYSKIRVMWTMNRMKYVKKGINTLSSICTKNFYHMKRIAILIVSIEKRLSYSVTARCSKNFWAVTPLNIQSKSSTLVSILFLPSFSFYWSQMNFLFHGSTSTWETALVLSFFLLLPF